MEKAKGILKSYDGSPTIGEEVALMRGEPYVAYEIIVRTKDNRLFRHVAVNHRDHLKRMKQCVEEQTTCIASKIPVDFDFEIETDDRSVWRRKENGL